MTFDNKHVYFFGDGVAEGKAELKNLLGGKGANLAEMTNLGLPVPAGFTITTEVCSYYYNNKKKYPSNMEQQVEDALIQVERVMHGKFGDSHNPLLLSVRSGARASMPGMMDTILNLGLNDETAEGMIYKTNDARFVYDAYRRFVQMYGDVVLGLKPQSKDDIDPFEEILQEKKKKRGVQLDTELNADDLKQLVSEFKAAIKKKTGKKFPENPFDQLWGAIGSVFGSWMNTRAIEYRKLYDIPESWGTAVNVQAMVFGNLGEKSGTGVAFTRNPATGEHILYGEFLMNAQGEDIVAGIRTPLPVVELQKYDKVSYREMKRMCNILEQHFKDMLDIEFTIQQGKLYMLQCRAGKRTTTAAIRIAVDMVKEKVIAPEEALMRIEPLQLDQLLRPVFDDEEKQRAVNKGMLLTKGLNAGPGAATGKIYFNAEDAEAEAKKGEDVILVRIETSPDDIRGMSVAKGIVTARGGMTSHAALVARQMGKVCIVGCSELNIDYKSRRLSVDRKKIVVKEGEEISIDGTTGEIIIGRVKTRPSEVVSVLIEKSLKPEKAAIYQRYAQIMKWADQFRSLRIRTNADQPNQCEHAVAFGAEGIGLCRTEHMFFGEDRITAVREMILAETKEEREHALAKLLPYQRKDFFGIFEVMKDRPVTIRTLDPPLHEFLPKTQKDIDELASVMKISKERIQRRISQLHEMNPMLGFRGCRLGILYPEITEMQVRAVFEAAAMARKKGIKAFPEIMIPFVGHVRELALQKEIINRIAEHVMRVKNVRIAYLVGTMIEIPRAALTAYDIGKVAEFFSFGTNDLTQLTAGLSRDDAGEFLPYYIDHSVYERDPFQSIDKNGVGKLMGIAVKEGRNSNNSLKVGICGEHGGDPSSVEFCHALGLNYVSCSPFRIPIARLAAARAVIQEKSNIMPTTPLVQTNVQKVVNPSFASSLSNAKRAILLKNSSLRRSKLGF
ncbi:MAG: pyruvate, phosphate dikinase [Ignavibacteria bacterium]|nr:pyruvate, phosphate dikinase [Ignavibacteria bacterium]